MNYRYEFDYTRDGDLRLRRTNYEILQDAYRTLRDALMARNRRAFDHGGSTSPYEQEVDDLNRMIARGDDWLAIDGYPLGEDALDEKCRAWKKHICYKFVAYMIISGESSRWTAPAPVEDIQQT